MRKFSLKEKEIEEVINNITKEVVRSRILNEGIRPDGRSMNEIRPLSSEVGLLPEPMVQDYLSRGQTQVLTVCTLGAMGDVQILDGLWEDEYKRYIHHYNFPLIAWVKLEPLEVLDEEIGHGF